MYTKLGVTRANHNYVHVIINVKQNNYNDANYAAIVIMYAVTVCVGVKNHFILITKQTIAIHIKVRKCTQLKL